MKNTKHKIPTTRYRTAFTLIETLVSLTVFVTVVTIATGAFTSVLKGQRHAFAVQNVQDNTSVLIESMAREVRTGTNFSVSGGSGSQSSDPSGSSAGTELNFTNAKGESVSYRVNNTRLERMVVGGCPSCNVFQPISSFDLQITNFRFVIQGDGSSDTRQPMITIIGRFENIGVRPEEQVSINVSTSITQRELDG
ncbi:hypothetical protein C4553_02180 [Candidatus Parcubacteria bacterium]|nr:MAG: hypothetical protein C4553_02180 [Candidatus Parcubacteria bacterium]